MMELLKFVLKILISAFMTEKFIKEMIVFSLEKLVTKTDNKVDDELVQKIKDALYSK